METGEERASSLFVCLFVCLFVFFKINEKPKILLINDVNQGTSLLLSCLSLF